MNQTQAIKSVSYALATCTEISPELASKILFSTAMFLTPNTAKVVDLAECGDQEYTETIAHLRKTGNKTSSLYKLYGPKN